MLGNMKRTKISISLLIVMVMTLMLAIPTFAATDYPMITLADSADFTVVGEIDDTEEMTVLGLDEDFITHPLGADEQYVTWTTSDDDVVLFDDGVGEVDEIVGSDTAEVVLKEQGTAVVTATYDTPTAPPVTVTSYIVVEDPNATPSPVTDIEVEVDFSVGAEDVNGTPLTDINEEYDEVPYFSLEAIYGTSFDDANVLKKDVTALHAFLYALEIEFSTENENTPIGNFNWDWVSANVDISSQGAYVSAVGTDDSATDWSRGWQFTVNTVDPGQAASVAPLSNGDNVTWGFLPW